MKLLYSALVAVLAGSLPLAMTGCDRASETHTKTTVDDSGAVKKHEERKTVIDADGDKKVTEEKRETRTDIR